MAENQLPHTLQERLDNYLDAIELELLNTDASRASRRSVLEMVEGQVVEMCLEKLTVSSDESEADRLFAQLDPPAMYAEGFEQSAVTAKTATVKAATPWRPSWYSRLDNVSRLALLSIGLLATPLVGFLAAALFPPEGVVFLFATLWISVLGAPVAAGFALRRIRASHGELKGRQLALISLGTSPLVVANLLIVLVGTGLDDFSILIAIAVTFGVLNYGFVCCIRRVIERWFPANGEVAELSASAVATNAPAVGMP